MVHCIKRIIQSKFDEPWPTWKQVPIEVQDMWFGELKKRYHWLPEPEHQMKNFETCGMNRLKGIFCQARKKLDRRPLWLSPEVWSELLICWKSEEFKARSAQAKENRASEDGIGSSLHTGGSIPTSEHKRRLKFTMKWKEVTSSENTNNSGDVPKISKIDLWISENVTKKGHIYGLGSEGAKYRCTSCSAQSKQSNVRVVDTPESRKIEEQMALVLQEKEALEKRVVELEKERLEKEEMARKIVELKQKGKQSEQRVNKKIKQMMKMLKMPAKPGAFSQVFFGSSRWPSFHL